GLGVDRVDGILTAGLVLRADAAVVRVHLALVGEGERGLILLLLGVRTVVILGHHLRSSSSSSTTSASTTSSSSDVAPPPSAPASPAPAAPSAPSAPSACDQLAVPTACRASLRLSRLDSCSVVSTSSFASESLASVMAS